MHTLLFKWLSVQFSRSIVSDSLQPLNRSTPGLPVHPNSQSLSKLMSIESVMPSSHLILCCPLLLLPPVPPSIRVFSNESTLRMRWPKYWSFSFSISPSNEHPSYSSLILRTLSACLKIKEMNCMHTKTVPSLKAEMN